MAKLCSKRGVSFGSVERLNQPPPPPQAFRVASAKRKRLVTSAKRKGPREVERNERSLPPLSAHCFFSRETFGYEAETEHISRKGNQFTLFSVYVPRGPCRRRESYHEIPWLGPRTRSFTSFPKREPRSRITGRIRQHWILYVALKGKIAANSI